MHEAPNCAWRFFIGSQNARDRKARTTHPRRRTLNHVLRFMRATERRVANDRLPDGRAIAKNQEQESNPENAPGKAGAAMTTRRAVELIAQLRELRRQIAAAKMKILTIQSELSRDQVAEQVTT